MDIDSPERITEKFPRKIIQARSENMFKLINDLRDYGKAESVFAFGEFVHFTGIDDDVEPSELDYYLHELGHQKVLIEEITPGIEDVFMDLMKIDIRIDGVRLKPIELKYKDVIFQEFTPEITKYMFPK
jgi:hypothetical protein